ncbi:MAG: sigma-70 family RNA polymerase sigma factor [Ferruginibacter sp.]|nr:sigma-70 family RNA polymerase sigma factor [Ferruginibacter sp.]
MSEKQFLTLIGQHQGIIHKICRLYRDSDEDREDLFQEIMFQLWQSFPSFEGKAKITSWMYRVALNTALASFRKKKPDIAYTEHLPDYPEEEPNEESVVRQEKLLSVLKMLDDTEKAIITLYLEDLSYGEIAAITGISENYAGVKLNRIKTKIQQLLNK